MEHKTIETDGVQILIDPSAQWFKFKSVVDGKVIRDLVTPRPAGSTFKEKCLIFPKNTINVKEQQSFLVDKNQEILTIEKSIGIWKCVGKALVDTSIANVPPIGTKFEESVWKLYFYSLKSKEIIARGFHTVINTFQPGKALIENELEIITAEREYEILPKIHGTAYVAPDGKSFVIEVTFDKNIKIELVQ